LEPHPGAFEEIVGNIRLNNLEGRIIPVNAGLSSSRGYIRVTGSSISGTQDLHHGMVLECKGECVEALTLGDVIREYGVDPGNSILKLDCEGCEYDVILGDYDHVRLFREVVVEYHRGYREILEIVRRDFTCRHEARYFFNDLTRQGLLYCVRQGL
jgi:FkbM family methyltransferase